MRRTSRYLTLQIKRRSVRVRPFRPQLRRERTQRLEHMLALSADRRHDAHAKVLRRVGLRGKHSGIVVDPGIYEQRAAFARARASPKRSMRPVSTSMLAISVR
jgi:hypothetical protein